MTNTKYMLDTSAVRDLIYGQNPTIRKRLLEVPMANICISAITEAELWRSALQHPQATCLGKAAAPVAGQHSEIAMPPAVD